MKYLIITLLLAVNTLFTNAQQNSYITELNINYYSDSDTVTDEYIKERCVLDLYHPEDKEGFPTVVWFHGGGLTGGEKFIPEAQR